MNVSIIHRLQFCDSHTIAEFEAPDLDAALDGIEERIKILAKDKPGIFWANIYENGIGRPVFIDPRVFKDDWMTKKFRSWVRQEWDDKETMFEEEPKKGKKGKRR